MCPKSVINMSCFPFSVKTINLQRYHLCGIKTEGNKMVFETQIHNYTIYNDRFIIKGKSTHFRDVKRYSVFYNLRCHHDQITCLVILLQYLHWMYITDATLDKAFQSCKN